MRRQGPTARAIRRRSQHPHQTGEARRLDAPVRGGEPLMPPRNQNKSKTEGLYKRCKHLSWDKCPCPWWGRVCRRRVSLEKWSRSSVTSKEMAKKVFARMKAAVLGRTFDKRAEHPEAIGND